MTNILLFSICIELAVLIVTIIVMLTKIVKTYILVVTMKNITAAIYEIWGGIAPDIDILNANEDFPNAETFSIENSGELE